MPGYAFGSFWLDATEKKLYKDGRHLYLEPQLRKLLRLVVEARSRFVTKDEIRNAIWGDRQVDFKHNLNVAVSKINSVLGQQVIIRGNNGECYVSLPVVYRDALDAPILEAPPDIKTFLDETKYAISPIDEYLPIYPVHAGLRRDEFDIEYRGEYEPPGDFMTLMRRFPPEPPINQLYSFEGWKDEIPSEDELDGKKGKKLTFYVRGGTWHHVAVVPSAETNN